MVIGTMREDLAQLSGDLDKITDGGGKKILTQLFLTYFLFCKAMARDWVLATAIPFYTYVLGADDATINNMYTASRSPFGIKTLWGSLSDALPFMGYHKRFYILWGVFVSICSIILLISIGVSRNGAELPASMALVQVTTLCIFGFEYGGATCDSLTQARYTELMKQMGTPTIVSFVWFLMNSCTLISSWGNLLLEDGNWLVLLYFAIPAALPMLYPAAMNWLAEAPATSYCGFQTEKLTKHRLIFMMSMTLALGALGGTALLIIQAEVLTRVIYFATLSTTFVVMSFIALPMNIAKPAFYMFLCSSLRLFFSGSLQIWYTSSNTHFGTINCIKEHDEAYCTEAIVLKDYTCIPAGPGFTTAYYQFVGNFLGAIAATVAVVIFEKVIVFWNVRAAFWITTVFSMCSAMLEISILQRWNHSLFGTDPLNHVESHYVDQIFFVVGTQAIDKIIEMLDFMPCNVLIGKLCPPNMEATIFAVLAGSQNFGTNLAFIFGSIVVERFGVTFNALTNECINPNHTVAGVTLTGLTWARVLGGIVLPAITVPLTFLLLPDKGLNENFLDETEGETELTAGAAGGEAPPQGMATGATGSIPRGTSQVSFVSLASISKGLPGGGDRMM